MHRKAAIGIAAIFWLAMGSFLLIKGLNFINVIVLENQKGPLFSLFERYQQHSMQAPLTLLFLGIVIGFVKAQVVFRKLVKKNVKRLNEMEKIPFMQIFPKSTWMVIVGMMFLGFLLKMAPIPLDIRSMILIAVGSALIQGSVFYLRSLVEPTNSLSL